jgi:hypothetical protein
MPEFLKSVVRLVTSRPKDTAPLNGFEGFQGNGAVDVRDRRGTLKSEIPEVVEKSIGDDPLAIYKRPGAKHVSPSKAMDHGPSPAETITICRFHVRPASFRIL